MLRIGEILRLIKKKGIIRSHRIARTRAYVAVSIIVGQRFEARLLR